MSKKVSQTRKQILTSAAVVFSRNHSASLNDVAEEAHVGRATVYRHFPNRDALIQELTIEAINDVLSVAKKIRSGGSSGLQCLQQLMEEMVQVGDLYNFLISMQEIGDSPEASQSYGVYLSILSEIVSELKQEGNISPIMSDAWAVITIESLFYSCIEGIYNGYIARKEASDLLVSTLLFGLAQKK